MNLPIAVAISMLLTASSLSAQTPPAGRGGRGAPQAPAEPAAPPIPALGQAATGTLVHAYGQAEHWSMRAIVLLSLGSDWHPDAVACVLHALRDKDERLVPYGLEVLRGMDDASLQQVATPELVGELIDKQLKRKNKLFTDRLCELLPRLLPAAKATDRRGFEEWWRAAKATYAPPAWEAPPAATGEQKGGTVATKVVERAFDLRDAGLDVAIIIDSTGSMQIAIDTARDAIDDVVALLTGIAPKLRLGLAHYKDLGDMGDGAKLLVPMTRDQKEVREKLAKLIAGGGGDVPERVERGVAVALSKEMGWNKDANRLLLVIGDAPPHPESEAPLYELVRKARELPFEVGKGPTTGPKKSEVRPFVTSTIATNPQAKASFEKIAEAGGGTSVMLEVGPPPAAPARGGKGGTPAPAQPAKSSRSVQQVVEHILLLSFGAQHRPQLQRFVRTFFEYRDAGLLN